MFHGFNAFNCNDQLALRTTALQHMPVYRGTMRAFNTIRARSSVLSWGFAWGLGFPGSDGRASSRVPIFPLPALLLLKSISNRHQARCFITDNAPSSPLGLLRSSGGCMPAAAEADNAINPTPKGGSPPGCASPRLWRELAAPPTLLRA